MGCSDCVQSQEVYDLVCALLEPDAVPEAECPEWPEAPAYARLVADLNEARNKLAATQAYEAARRGDIAEALGLGRGAQITEILTLAGSANEVRCRLEATRERLAKSETELANALAAKTEVESAVDAWRHDYATLEAKFRGLADAARAFCEV
jgi:hypothetical protein